MFLDHAWAALQMHHLWLILHCDIVTVASPKRTSYDVFLKVAAVRNVSAFLIAEDNVQAIHTTLLSCRCANTKLTRTFPYKLSEVTGIHVKAWSSEVVQTYFVIPIYRL